MAESTAIDYLNPQLPEALDRVVMPVVEANDAVLRGYGCLFDDPKDMGIEIVRWPAKGWRPVDADTGDEGGTTQGHFTSTWKGDVHYGHNDAVSGHYVMGYAVDPSRRAQAGRLRNEVRFPPRQPVHRAGWGEGFCRAFGGRNGGIYLPR